MQARLREVQEVIAEGDFETASFYYDHHIDPAAASRFREIVTRYPNFSKADVACWDLAQTLDRLKKPQEAVPYYDRILSLYPLSPLVPRARARLVELHQPIPQPTKAELARARADATDAFHEGWLGKLGGVLRSSPNLGATRHGPVILGSTSASVVLAKTAAPTSAGGTVVAEPVGASALKTGQASDPGAAKAALKSSPEASHSNQPHVSKSKKRRSLIKRLVKPW